MNAQTIIGLCRKLPNNFIGRKLALLVRRPVKYGDNSEIRTNVWGLEMTLKPRGNVTESHLLFTPHQLDFKEREYMARLMKGRSSFVFYDVGANIGAYSYWVLSQGPASASVVMIEASPYLCSRIRANLALNEGLNAEVLNVGVSDGRGALMFLQDDTNLGESCLVDPADYSGDPSRLREVPLQQLSAIIQGRGETSIDLMKLDIEGMEAKVLEDVFTHLGEQLWPRAIIVEMKDAPEYRRVEELLAKCGYRMECDFGNNQVFSR